MSNLHTFHRSSGILGMPKCVCKLEKIINFMFMNVALKTLDLIGKSFAVKMVHVIEENTSN